MKGIKKIIQWIKNSVTSFKQLGKQKCVHLALKTIGCWYLLGHFLGALSFVDP